MTSLLKGQLDSSNGQNRRAVDHKAFLSKINRIYEADQNISDDDATAADSQNQQSDNISTKDFFEDGKDN